MPPRISPFRYTVKFQTQLPQQLNHTSFAILLLIMSQISTLQILKATLTQNGVAGRKTRCICGIMRGWKKERKKEIGGDVHDTFVRHSITWCEGGRSILQQPAMAGCPTTSSHMLSLGSCLLPLKAVPLSYAQSAHQRLRLKFWRPGSSFSTMHKGTRFVGFPRGGGRFVTCNASSSGAAAADYPSSDPWTSISENLKSISSSIPLPRKPGSSKQRYIAGVDQTDRVDPWLLADEDSRFAELYGVQLHYKIAHPPTDNESTTSDRVNTLENKKASTSVPAILLHGFGASLFSWSRVLKPLADIIGSRVVAFDRPGFGLTSRPQIKGTYWNGLTPS